MKQKNIKVLYLCFYVYFLLLLFFSRAQSIQLSPVDLEVFVGGRGQDMFLQLEAGFGYINPMLPFEALEKKLDQKTKQKCQGLACNVIRFVSSSLSFWCGRTSKSDKKWPSNAHSKLGQKWRPGLFGPKISHFGHIF